MIPPPVPTGGLIGQAILHDESHGQGNDVVGVARLGQGICGRVGVEEAVAVRAAVLRVNEFDIAGLPRNEVAEVMQHAGAGPIAKARLAAARPWETWIVAAAANGLCLWQIFRARDAFGGVWEILAWTNTATPSLPKGSRPGIYGICSVVSWPISMRWC